MTSGSNGSGRRAESDAAGAAALTEAVARATRLVSRGAFICAFAGIVTTAIVNEFTHTPRLGFFFGTALVAISMGALIGVAALRLSRTLFSVADRDQRRLERISRVIVGGERDPLGAEDMSFARRCGEGVATLDRLRSTSQLLLTAGIALTLLGQATNGSGGASFVSLGFAAALIVLLAIGIPLSIRRHRHTRRWLSEHPPQSDANPA